ncbi:hypothetical protein OIU84_003463 [Salix udensis]|uniref:non-specific serine/threonine protein kinase n=1 Tax=Salix udensis TaxID=889485 RepID=A0AAD6K0C4_9ROSI|nr:hypothetical protein OIU84_003463 [Salix udensis]
MFYKCYVGLFLLMFKVAASIENGFVVNGNFELGGGAEFSQKGLFRLTNSSTFGVGRAFYSQPLNFKNSSNGSSVSFSTTFVFAFVLDEDHLPGQGMAFMIAPSKNLTGALPSQYLGLFNSTNNGDPSNHVVAIELDTSQNPEFGDINRNHVGIDVNSLESVKSAPAGYFDNENGEFKSIVLSSGEPIQAWVEYDAPETQLNVTLAPIHTSKPSLPLLSLNIDISPIILEQMYVGFSSSTGQLVQSHYVLGWSFLLDGKAPELDLSKLSFFTGKEQSKRKGRDPLVVGLSITGVVLLIIATISILIILWRRKKAEFTEILEDWEDLQTTHVAGTLGYIAPELARSGKPTPSTDVYAFGAFCLEVACGRRPVEPKTSAKEMILVDWVYSFWMEGKILSTMDPKLDREWKAEEAELVLKLGLLCSHGVAEGRPRMSQVLIYLKGQAALPENLNAHVKAQEGRGESENHAILCYSSPSLTITNSLISVGR